MLAYIEKKALGIWKISNQIANRYDSDLVSISWIDSMTFRHHSSKNETQFDSEWHAIYYGNTAQNFIEFSSSNPIPPNITIGVHQGENVYWIHVISYEDPNQLNYFHIENYLELTK